MPPPTPLPDAPGNGVDTRADHQLRRKLDTDRDQPFQGLPTAVAEHPDEVGPDRPLIERHDVIEHRVRGVAVNPAARWTLVPAA